MPHDPNYVPSQFDHRDYRLLARMAKSPHLKTLIHNVNYRDKKIQRSLDNSVAKTLHCPLDQIMLYVNAGAWEEDIVKWRLTLAK
jgi:hypothetical protein